MPQTVANVAHAEPRLLVECITGSCLVNRHHECDPLDDIRDRLFVCACDCHEQTEPVRALLREARPLESAALAMLAGRKS